VRGRMALRCTYNESGNVSSIMVMIQRTSCYTQHGLAWMGCAAMYSCFPSSKRVPQYHALIRQLIISRGIHASRLWNILLS